MTPVSSSRPDFSGISDARRRNMAAIAGKHTKPELLVRRLTHAMGYRYRLHASDLPGRPDLVFPGRRKIIEVRGCFWHRHPGCPLAAMPRTHAEFWQSKFSATVARDAHNLAALLATGWSVLVIWECEVDDVNLADRLSAFLGPSGHRTRADLC
jgi:DNA mismatch endonuclease Vsr